eukprot:gene55998-76763_t
MRHWRQIAQQPLTAAWRDSRAPVLAVYGEADFAAIDDRDHRLHRADRAALGADGGGARPPRGAARVRAAGRRAGAGRRYCGSHGDGACGTAAGRAHRVHRRADVPVDAAALQGAHMSGAERDPMPLSCQDVEVRIGTKTLLANASVTLSPGGLALLGPGIGNIGDRVIAYLDHIGRVEGKVTRIIDNGFAMTVGATPRKRDKLAATVMAKPLSMIRVIAATTVS